NSQLTCVMFRGDRKGLDFQLESGQEVTVGGAINVYERDGKYQLYAKKIVLAGDGALNERYEKLKKKLQEKGYFDDDRKLPLPKYARTVGVVTASTGAAIQDIINISSRRNPYVQLILYPARVQGQGAAETVAQGIETLDRMGLDLIIVGRGGGSMEDLWAFNEEVVADAIFHSTTPIISAVGHETDFTIADFVADMRAPTPSAAAELAVFDVANYLSQVRAYRDRLAYQMNFALELRKKEIRNYQNRLQLLNPENRLMDQRQRMMDLEEKLQRLMELSLQNSRHQMEILAGRLDGVSPLKRLSAGYGFVADQENKPLDSVEKLQIGQTIGVTLKDGKIVSRIERIDQWN
ncbi:MAG: exodeoxyribonuclease VII large subunit, partial [Eubacterium sp.]|nr:exodeoxyribonuclease VII large subunit [Eubacterium sp.]